MPSELVVYLVTFLVDIIENLKESNKILFVGDKSQKKLMEIAKF